MNMSIFDSKVLGEIVAASPRTSQSSVDLAKAIVEKLDEFSKDDQHCEVINDGEESRYYRTTVVELTRCVNVLPQPSIHLVGRACSDMGLTKIHRSDGRWVAWNDAQIAIARRALGGG